MSPSDLNAGNFFASRAGVCVYVTVRNRPLRVQFAAPDGRGVVVEGPDEDAEEALRIARSALSLRAAEIAPLFDKVGRD